MSSSWRGASGDSAPTSPTQPQRPSAPALTLDRVIGQTCLHNSALAVNPITGDVAYPAGCVVVIYQPRRNRQFRYFRASKAVSCLAFSRDGGMLAVGERGHQPSATVWSLATGTVVRELAGGHRFGIGCIAFTPSGGGVVTMGFKHDRMLRVWDLRLAAGATNVRSTPERVLDGSASPVSPRYPSSDSDSPPPPPPPTSPPPRPSSDGEEPDESKVNGEGAPAASPRTTHEARQVASARIPQRVRAMDFTSDGECLVTCGDAHVKFWKMPGGRRTGTGAGGGGGFMGIGADALPSKAAFPSTPPGGASRRGEAGGGGGATAVAVLEGWAATIVNELKDATFVDISSSGKGGGGGGGAGGGAGGGGSAAGLDSVFCVTSEGVLCAFTRGGVMEHWVSLEAPAAYGLSVHEDGTLAAACADGLVRLFKADDLRYVATLPRPPPLGRANISSVRELQEIADLSAAAAKAAKAVSGGGAGSGSVAVLPEEDDDVNVGTIGDETAFGGIKGDWARFGAGDGGGGSAAVVRYPAALGCRLSPSGTKVVCIYADRGLFIWDVTDPLCVGKYRSFLAHGGCIWDVQRMPARISRSPHGEGDQPPPLPDVPAGAMVTCSADNTVRLWDLGALDGNAAGEVEKHHSGRWSNIYSKQLLRVLYGSGGGAGDADKDGLSPTKDKEEQKRARSGGIPRKGSGPVSLNRLGGDRADEAAIEEMVLAEGPFDPEAPHKPDWSCSPRSLAVHPDGSQVACGDKAGNIRVYDLAEMELAHSQSAHDAEVLCLAYSPMMVPAHGGGRGAATPPPRSPPDVGGRVSGGEKGKNGGGDTKALAQSADEGVGTGVSSVGMPSASAKITDQEGESKANVGADGGGEAGSEAAAVMSVSSWEAVDPLDPAAAAEKMLSLSFMSSLSSMATPPTAVDGTAGSGGSGGIGFRPDADEHKASGTNKNGVLPPPPSFSTGGGWAHPRRDASGTPLVLLASASRDRLVHIFDASLSSSCGRGAGAATTAAASASAFLKSDGGLRAVGGGAGGVTAVGQARVGAREGLGGLDARLSGKVAAMNAGVEADIAAAAGAAGAAGFPLLKTLDSHSGSVTAVKFTRDGKRLITAGGDKLLVLNSVRGPHVHRLRAVSVPQGTIYGLDVDPTNNYVVTAGQDKRLNIWSAASGKHVRAYKVEPSTPQTTEPLAPSSVDGGTGGLGAMAIGGVAGSGGGGGGSGGGSGAKGDAGGELFKVDLDPTGMYAAACSFDKWIRLFDFYSGKCLAKVAGHSELATGVRFTPDGRRLITTGGDGVMFVWRLSSELQQSMHDRMCELRPAGASPAGSVGVDTTSGIARGTTTTTANGTSGCGASDQAAAAPAAPISSSAPRVPVGAGASGSGSSRESANEGGGGGSTAGGAQPLPTPARAAAETARAKAKADAKARLRFQRYQLPAWAHTQEGSSLAPAPATSTATQATTADLPPHPSPPSPLETDVGSESIVAGRAAPTARAETKDSDDGARDSPGDGDSDAREGSGEGATTPVGSGNGGEPMVEGRDSPPPVLAALVSAVGAGGGGESFSRHRRDSSGNSNTNSNSDSKNDLSYSSSINDTCYASNPIETTSSSIHSVIDGSEVIANHASLPVLPPPPPPAAEEAETAAGSSAEESGRSPSAVYPAVLATTAATPTSLHRIEGSTAAAAAAAAAANGGGSVAANPRTGWGMRRAGSGMGLAAPTASGAAPSPTATPPVAVTGGSKDGLLAAARGRWERRGLQEEEEGSLEIVGHRTGNRKGSARSSGLSLASLEERTGERRGSVAKVDASAAKDAAAERAVEGVDAGSPEEEDGVMLGGSDDDADEHEYSLDEDFEEAGRSQDGAGRTPKTTGNPGSSSPTPGDASGDGVSRLEERCSGDRTVSPGGDGPDRGPAGLFRRGGGTVDTSSGNGNQGVAGGNPGCDAAAAAAAVAGLQRKVAEKTTAHSVAVATAAAAAAAAVTAASTTQGRTERGEGNGSASLDTKDVKDDGRDVGGKAMRRGSSVLRSRGNGDGGDAAAAGVKAVEGSPSSTMSSGSSISATAEQRDEDAAKRGRRISETEGAVKAMRRKLSAMGFLEVDGGGGCDGVGGDDDDVEGAGSEKLTGEDLTAGLLMDTCLESPAQPPPLPPPQSEVFAAAADIRADVGGGGAVAEMAEDAVLECIEDVGSAEDNEENRRVTSETEMAASPLDAALEDEQPPLPRPSSPPSPSRRETMSPLPYAEQAAGRATDADESSDRLAAVADARITTANDADTHVSAARTPVVVISDEHSLSRPKQTSEGRRTKPPDSSIGSSGSALSSGRRWHHHRRPRKHASTAEEADGGCERPTSRSRRRRQVASPYSSPVPDRVVILPRPDAEYEAALRRLTAAASHAAELYRELTEASSATLGSSPGLGGAGATDEDSVVGMRSFPSTASSGPLGRGSLGSDGAASRGSARAGIERGERKRDGSTISSSGGGGAMFASALSAQVPSDSGVDDVRGESEDSENDYEDDEEWEDEEEDDGTYSPGTSAAEGGGGERRRRRGEAGTSGPLSLERSFREGFASVNGVLSAIAGKTGVGGVTFVDSSRIGAGSVGTGSIGDLAADRRDPRSASASTGEAAGREVEGASGLSASPGTVSLPPATPSRQVPRLRGSGSGGNGLPQTAFCLTPDGGGEGAVAGSGVGGGLGLGGRADEGGQDQFPAEMSGMLERYSEMILRVVQDKLEARMADGTLRPST